MAAAIAAERAFYYSAKASTPDRWRGAFLSSVNREKEIDERNARGRGRALAAALQSIATYLAAGAAIEAAAASQRGYASFSLLAIGIMFVVPALRRRVKAQAEMRYTDAWFKRLSWAISRKYVSSSDPAEEDAAFAHDHPKEAKILREGEP